jgi:hypothetical protein
MERGQSPLLRLVMHDHRRGMRHHMHVAARQLVALRHFQRQVMVPLAAFASDQQECEQAERAMWPPLELAGALHAALRAATALLAALLLHLGGTGVPGLLGAARASVAEDKLLEFVRQVEVKVDSAVGAVKDAAAQVWHLVGPPDPLPPSCCADATPERPPRSSPPLGAPCRKMQGSEGPDADEGRQLIQEVAEVVETNFSDARASGYDPAAWLELKERLLARPLRDREAAYT